MIVSKHRHVKEVIPRSCKPPLFFHNHHSSNALPAVHYSAQYERDRDLYRCQKTEFNPNGQLFFQPMLQAMRVMIHLGETLPDDIKDAYQLSGGVLALWAFAIFSLMLATFGIGAASGLFLFIAGKKALVGFAMPMTTPSSEGQYV